MNKIACDDLSTKIGDVIRSELPKRG